MATFTFDIVQANSHKQGERIKFYEQSFIIKIIKFFANYCFPISLVVWLFLVFVGLFLNLFFVDKFILSLLGLLVSIGGLSLWFLWLYHDRLVMAKPTLTIGKAKNLITEGQSFNFAECVDPESGVGVLLHAYREAKKSRVNILDPVFLFLGLTKSKAGSYLFARVGIDPKSIIDFKIKPILETLPKGNNQPIRLSDEFYSILEESLNIALSVTGLKTKKTINTGDIIVAAFRKSKFFKDLLVDMNLKVEDIANIVNWYYLQKRFFIKKPFWDPATVISGIGDEWAFGYTNMLNRFGTCWTRQIASVVDRIHTYGCADVIAEMERILSRGEKNNVLLVGEQGTGKQPAVNGLVAKMIRRETLPELRYKKVYKIDTGALLSGASREGEIQARITAIFNEALYAGNIVLFFEDIHSIFSSEEHTGAVNASSITLPYLRQSGLQLIGTTTPENFHRDIEANPGIANVFAKVEVREPSKDVVISVLQDAIPRIEYRNKVIFLYHALKEAVDVAERYIYDKPFPAKAIELVDEVAADIRKERGANVLITKEDVDKVASQKTNIPVGQVEESEKEKLLRLEEFLHKRVIGQDEAIQVIADALRRARSGLVSGKRPIGTFLFLGPTGVGKTETARALAAAYFGSEKNMIRLDMSEFGEPSSVYRIIGAPPRAGKEGTQGELTKRVKDNPFSLILLDELEKTHPDILNLFLQVFDEGRLTDGRGKLVNFTNTIIIATSNAGSELIRKEIKKGAVNNEILKEKLLDYLQTKRIFRPEFLNRFDAIVAFHPLTKEQLNQIIRLMINDLNKRLSEKEVKVELTNEAVEKVIEIGFDPVFGARPLRRALQDKVENLVAQRLLKGSLQKGQTLVIKGEDIK